MASAVWKCRFLALVLLLTFLKPSLSRSAAATNTPTVAPGSCSNLFNNAESLGVNGTWSGASATRSIVTTGPPGAITENIGALKVNITAPSTSNTSWAMLSGFTPVNWTPYQALMVDMYFESGIWGSGFREMYLYVNGGCLASSAVLAPPDGPNTLIFWLDNPGGCNLSNVTSLNFEIHTDVAGPGNVYIDNVRLLSQACGFSPTISATRSNTLTASPTRTNSPTPGSYTSTPSTTPTPDTGVCGPSHGNSTLNQDIQQYYTWAGKGGYVVGTSYSCFTVCNPPSPVTVAGIPAGATVAKAFLYILEGTGGPDWTKCETTTNFNGSVITGSMIGTGSINFDGSCHVRYDVTSLVSGNGVYTVTKTGTTASYRDQQIVVIYNDPTQLNTVITIADGLYFWHSKNCCIEAGVYPSAETVDWSCTGFGVCNPPNVSFARGGYAGGTSDNTDHILDPATFALRGDVGYLDDITEGNSSDIDGPTNISSLMNPGETKGTWSLSFTDSHKASFGIQWLLWQTRCNVPIQTPTPFSTPTPTSTPVCGATGSVTIRSNFAESGSNWDAAGMGQWLIRNGVTDCGDGYFTQGGHWNSNWYDVADSTLPGYLSISGVTAYVTWRGGRGNGSNNLNFDFSVNGTTTGVLAPDKQWNNPVGALIWQTDSLPLTVAGGWDLTKVNALRYNLSNTSGNAGGEDINVDCVYFAVNWIRNCVVTNTPTVTPTWTNTRTYTPSPTQSPTPSQTPTWTNTRTPTPSPTVTSTASPTPTWTVTNTYTFSPTQSFTATPTPTWTQTYTYTFSPTRSFTATDTPTRTPTATPTFSASPTPTFTPTPTWTVTHTYTNSPTRSFTATDTPTKTNTPTPTFSASPSPTFTPTPTWTVTYTYTFSPSRSFTATQTATWTPSVTYTDSPTRSFTPTVTQTFTPSATPTYSVSITDTPSVTQTSTDTYTYTLPPSRTGTRTITETFTETGTHTASASPTPTRTASPTPTATDTFTFSPTATVTITNTCLCASTPTPTFTLSPTETGTDTATPTATTTLSPTPSSTVTDTPTPSASPTSTFSATPTFTASDSPTASTTPTPTFTVTLTATVTTTATSTSTDSPSRTDTATPTATFTPTPTGTETPSSTPSPSLSSTMTPSATRSWTATPTPSHTPPGTPTNSPSWTPTSPPGVLVKVFVYNEAGEIVGIIDDGSYFDGPVEEFLFGGGENTLTDGQPELALIFPADGTQQAVTLLWNGLGLDGKPLSNGAYVIKVESVDSLGITTVITGSASILRSPATVTVKVFNEAGELVWSEVKTGVSANQQDVKFQGNTINTGLSPSTPGGSVQVVLGPAGTVTWAGVDSQGQPLANGSYIVEVDVSLDGKTTAITETVTLLSSLAGPGTPLVNPNPVAGNQPVEIRGSSTGRSPVVSLKVKVYTVSGELIRSLESPSDSLLWDLKVSGGSPASGGLYLLLVESKTADGGVSRAVSRLVVLR